MLYEGRLGWKQCIPFKRSQFGIKYYILCDAITDYIWSFIIYFGKGTRTLEEFSSLSMSAQINFNVSEGKHTSIIWLKLLIHLIKKLD